MKNRIIGYIKETIAEVRKVVWPDRRYVTVATLIILFLVIAVSLFLSVVDWGLAAIFKALLR